MKHGLSEKDIDEGLAKAFGEDEDPSTEIISTRKRAPEISDGNDHGFLLNVVLVLHC